MQHPAGLPFDLNDHVAKRMRQRRRELGLTQSQIATRVGISFQQVHRLEISASPFTINRLWEIAGVLDVSITYFFEGAPTSLSVTEPQMRFARP